MTGAAAPPPPPSPAWRRDTASALTPAAHALSTAVVGTTAVTAVTAGGTATAPSAAFDVYTSHTR